MAGDLGAQDSFAGGVETVREEKFERGRDDAFVGRVPVHTRLDPCGSGVGMTGLHVEFRAGKGQIQVARPGLEKSIVEGGGTVAVAGVREQAGELEGGVAVARGEFDDLLQPGALRRGIALRFGESFQPQRAAQVTRGLLDGFLPAGRQFRRAARALVEADEPRLQVAVEPVVAGREREAAFEGIPGGVKLAAAFVQPGEFAERGGAACGVGVSLDVLVMSDGAFGQVVFFVVLGEAAAHPEVAGSQSDGFFPGIGGLEGLTGGQEGVTGLEQQVHAAAVVWRELAHGGHEQGGGVPRARTRQGKFGAGERGQRARGVDVGGAVVGGGGFI